MTVAFLSAGDTAFSVELGSTIERATNARVIALNTALGEAIAAGRLAGVVETVPSFRSVMVHYDPLATSRAELEGEIRSLLADDRPAIPKGRGWRIPVCYAPELAPDLGEVAASVGATPDRVVALHAGGAYFVYMMGFMPGFGYLGDLPEALALPRRKEPRVRVPGGSVAIAGKLTGVYPWESPGGWHLIGRTPVALFDLRRRAPALLAPGDRVRFAPIERAAFEAMATSIAAGEFDLGALVDAA